MPGRLKTGYIASVVRFVRTERTASRWLVRAVLAILFLAFTCIYPYIGTVNNPNENVRTYMTMAIVEHHTFRIDKIVERHGWVNDMARAPDKKTGESHLYSVKAPAVSYAGVPFYFALTKLGPRYGYAIPTNPSENVRWLRATTFVLRLFTVQLPCFVFLIFFERFLRRYTNDPILRLCAVVAAGVGTNYLAYSLMFASHAPFACAAFGSFAIITAERALPERRLSRAFWAGFLAGLATLLEYHAFPVSGALALYALTTFYRPTRLVVFGVGATICAAALMFFQWRAFGSPFTPGHKMSENPAFAALLNQGLFGIGKPNFQVFRDISLSHTYGFFGTSPFMWMGLLAIPAVAFARDRRDAAITHVSWIATMFLLWLTVSAAINWRGGWTVGPRYLGAAPPFFAFGAVFAAEVLCRGSLLRRTIARGVFGGLALASVAQMGVLGALYNTIPESVTRPLPQFALPLIRVGFVPHHIGELFGWTSPRTWYVVVATMIAALIIAAIYPFRDRIVTYGIRIMVIAAFAYVGLRPAFSDPQPGEGGDAGVDARRSLTVAWEPPGRDHLSTMRALASKYPCAWYRIADYERILGQTGDADRDEKRAGRPRTQCR